MKPPSLMTIREVMEAAKISRTTLYWQIKKGNLLAVNVGGRVRIPVDEFRKWIKSLKTESKAIKGPKP